MVTPTPLIPVPEGELLFLRLIVLAVIVAIMVTGLRQ
jgi:hypothetical protein